jgi:hypothetical protein
LAGVITLRGLLIINIERMIIIQLAHFLGCNRLVPMDIFVIFTKRPWPLCGSGNWRGFNVIYAGAIGCEISGNSAIKEFCLSAVSKDATALICGGISGYNAVKKIDFIEGAAVDAAAAVVRSTEVAGNSAISESAIVGSGASDTCVGIIEYFAAIKENLRAVSAKRARASVFEQSAIICNEVRAKAARQARAMIFSERAIVKNGAARAVDATVAVFSHYTITDKRH